MNKTRHLAWLDYTRFASALSVVSFHYLYNGPRGPKITTITDMGLASSIAQYGYLGVDVFFIISGFVIASSMAKKTAREFAVGRIVRLYPTYILCMTITSICAYFLGSTVMNVTPIQYLANLSMNAPLFGYQFVDGVYWTLVLEITFYAAVLMIILLGLRDYFHIIVAIWAAALFINNIILSGHNYPLFGSYYSLFAAGCVLSMIHRQGGSPFRTLLLAGVGLLSIYGVIERAATMLPNQDAVLVVSMIFVTIYFFFIGMAFNTRDFSLPQSSVMGALTYPIYLLHAHIGYMLIDRFGNDDNKWIVLIIVLSFIIVLSYFVAFIFERKYYKSFYSIIDSIIRSPFEILRMPSKGKSPASRRAFKCLESVSRRRGRI